MNEILGVDSLVLASSTTNNKTLCESVKAQWRDVKFWGRYISAGGNFPQRLTADECRFLHENSLSILLVFNQTYHLYQPDQATFENGKRDANNAILAMRELEKGYKTITDDVCIYANIDAKMNVTPHWILGWWSVMFSSKYAGVGGLYMGQDISAAYCEAFCHAKALINPGHTKWSGQKFPEVHFYNLAFSSFLWAGQGVKFSPVCHPTGRKIRQEWPQHQINGQNVDKDYSTQEGFDYMWHP